MKILKFVLLIVLGLFIFNPLSAQKLASYSGVIHKIPKYPSNMQSIDDSIYGHFKIAFSKPENCSRIELRCYYGNNNIKTISFDFFTVDEKKTYEVGGISRLVKESGIVLDVDLLGIITSWNNSNYKISATLYNSSGTEVSGNWIPLTYKVWE